jgi:hypothetical protein
MITDLELRQSQMADVVERFRQSGPHEGVEVLLLACGGPGIGSYRGICMHGGNRPVQVKQEAPPATPPPLPSHVAQSSVVRPPPLPTAIAKAEAMPQVDSLRVGEHMHLAINSDHPGYLHMFNLGMSGSVAKLFPHTPEKAQYITAGRRLFITQAGASPFTSGPYRELGDSSDPRALGKTNGYPERILAIVVDSHVNIKASDLHPDWTKFDTTYRGAGGWGVVQDETSWFWHLPSVTWTWGIIEVPVEG